MSNMQNRTAVVVVSHNNPTLTDSLCDNVARHTRAPMDLYCVETGSRLDRMSKYATFWVKDGVRMTRGFNWGIKYALWNEKIAGTFHYDSFWLLVNDAKLFECDSLTPLVEFMRKTPDCGQIHPFIDNSPLQVLRKQNPSGCRKVSFVEIICPLLSRKAIEIENLLDERYFYGWGLDYEIPYTLHRNNLRTYISDDVGVVHNAGTTVNTKNDEQITTVQQQFAVSRKNMIEGLTSKHGASWGKVFYDAIPQDVSPDAYVGWVSGIGGDWPRNGF